MRAAKVVNWFGQSCKDLSLREGIEQDKKEGGGKVDSDADLRPWVELVEVELELVEVLRQLRQGRSG